MKAYQFYLNGRTEEVTSKDISSMASKSGEGKFYKSYIKNVKLVDVRPFKITNNELLDLSFEFIYKGDKYKVIENTIVVNGSFNRFYDLIKL